MLALSPKCQRKRWKFPLSTTPLLLDAPSPGNPCEYPREVEPYIIIVRFMRIFTVPCCQKPESLSYMSVSASMGPSASVFTHCFRIPRKHVLDLQAQKQNLTWNIHSRSLFGISGTVEGRRGTSYRYQVMVAVALSWSFWRHRQQKHFKLPFSTSPELFDAPV